MTDESNFEKVKRYFKLGKQKEEIVKLVPNITRKTVTNYLAELKQLAEDRNEDLGTGSVNLNVDSDEDLSLDILARKFEIDLDVWQPTQIVGNQWAKNKQLKIKFDRIIPDDCLHKAIDNVVAKINGKGVFKPSNRKYIEGDTLLEISIYDHHFGKLAHHNETGNNYDLKIAQKLYYEAFDNILTRAKKSYKVDKILFPVGQDLFHINNEISTTAAGTFQDSDSRLTKIFEKVQETLINCIDEMLKVAPVDIVYVPDNHGPITSYFMCKVLESYYRNEKNITFNIDNRSRKYYSYGNTLIGMSHGHSEKADTLALTMACEAKEEWSKTVFHEFHLGHFHKRKERNFNSIDSIADVVVRYLPSLCGTDKWHETKGYNTTRKFCECYLYDKNHGPTGSLIFNKVEGDNEYV